MNSIYCAAMYVLKEKCRVTTWGKWLVKEESFGKNGVQVKSFSLRLTILCPSDWCPDAEAEECQFGCGISKMMGPKGQKKSKWFFQVSFKKRTNEFDFTTTCFCLFFGRNFEINWPLKSNILGQLSTYIKETIGFCQYNEFEFYKNWPWF